MALLIKLVAVIILIILGYWCPRKALIDDLKLKSQDDYKKFISSRLYKFTTWISMVFITLGAIMMIFFSTGSPTGITGIRLVGLMLYIATIIVDTIIYEQFFKTKIKQM